jgi:hypothetical protein
MRFAGTTGYGSVVFLIIFVAGVCVSWPLKIADESGIFTTPAWLLQLIFWGVIASVTAIYALWLERHKTFVLVQVPDDPTRFVEGRRSHTALWIPVRYWPWIYAALGVYLAFSVLNEGPK